MNKQQSANRYRSRMNMVLQPSISCITYSFFILFLVSCTMTPNDTYQAKKVKESTNLENVDWQQAELLSDFISPWQDAPAHTTFRALWDDNNLYFRFDVVEPNIMVYSDTNDEQEVVRSERVEIFFRQNEDLNPYYCLEMDASGRVFDYQAAHYRQFKPGWSWPEGQLEVKASNSSDGYKVTGRVSLQSLKNLGLLNDHKLQVGLFRGRRTSQQESGSDADFHWISWIHPETAEPDFHVASSFGQLLLVK